MAITINSSEQQYTNTTDTVGTGSSGGYSGYSYGAIPGISAADLSNLTTPSITTSNTIGPKYTIASGSGGTGLTNANVIWTTGTDGYHYIEPGRTNNRGGKLVLKGENADVDINGKSLVQWMQAMEERMNWMQPNVELEKEWTDLKKLGDRYRKLEQQCRDKAEVWNRLKSLPKSDC
jgi:hypothetical protein